MLNPKELTEGLAQELLTTRHRKLSKIKNKIISGAYNVNTAKIAKSMFQSKTEVSNSSK
ncbi:MAG: flagellar biosynthesis anti-sigma factor FlgM [bacterium]|nr:flagellar biosynthesis anti-sigma factor FlgM [bacterium]